MPATTTGKREDYRRTGRDEQVSVNKKCVAVAIGPKRQRTANRGEDASFF